MQANTESICDVPKINPPTFPIVDWRPIRGSLGSFRAGYEEIEQLVSQLLDEIDAAYEELEAERARADARPLTRSAELAASPGPPSARGEGSDGATELAIVGPNTTTALLPAVVESDPARFDGALVRRIAELEQDRAALQSEVDYLRGQVAEQTSELSEERHRSADERSAWADELRQLREAIHRQMETLGTTPSAGVENGAFARPASQNASPAPDPVLGPLVAQFKVLQRDADRRRKGDGGRTAQQSRKPT